MRTDIFLNRENVGKVLAEDFNLKPWEITMIMQQNNKDLALSLNQYYKKKMKSLERSILSTPISDLPLADYIINHISNILKSQNLDRDTLSDLYFVAKGLYGETLDKRTKELLLHSIRALTVQLGRQKTLKEDFKDKMDIVAKKADIIVEDITYMRDIEGYIYLPTENYSGKVMKINSKDRHFLYPIALYSTLSCLEDELYTESLVDVLLIK